jgi:hypothetical protein
MVRGKETFQEECFFVFHLYSLVRPATVMVNQTKQMSLLCASGVGVCIRFVVVAGGMPWYTRFDHPLTPMVGVFLELENSKKNGMGMPLPKGVVRVYKQDSKGALQFAGEDNIDHTPKDETIRVRMGNAFDVVAERIQTSYEVLSSGHLYRSAYQVTIRNHKDEAITVSSIEMLAGDWTITQSSHEYQKETATRVRFDVPVKANGSAELTYTVELRR